MRELSKTGRAGKGRQAGQTKAKGEAALCMKEERHMFDVDDKV